MSTRSRAELKGFFKTNSIPTQSNFEDLIDSALNQIDDGLARLTSDALTINAAGPEQALLRFSNVDATGSTPAWLVKQSPTGAAPAGLVFQDAGNAANGLFIQSGTGNVGVGTLTPAAKLDVAGSGGVNVDLNVNGCLRSNNNDGGLWVSTDRFVGGFNTNMIGFNNNGWQLAVAPSGNVGVGTQTPGAKLEVAGNLKVSGGAITPSVGDGPGYGIMWPTDPFGGTGDSAWIRYHNVRGGESGTLEIGINNDGDDDIYLNPSGNVGVGTLTPSSKLHVVGDIAASGKLVVGGAWSLAVDGRGTLMIMHNTNIVARFSATDADRFCVYANVDGNSPYFHYTSAQQFNNYVSPFHFTATGLQQV